MICTYNNDNKNNNNNIVWSHSLMDNSNPVETLHSTYMSATQQKGDLSVIRLIEFIRNMMKKNYISRFKGKRKTYTPQTNIRQTSFIRGCKRNKRKRSPFCGRNLELIKRKNSIKTSLNSKKLDRTLNPMGCRQYAIYLSWWQSTTYSNLCCLNYIVPGL